MTRPSDPKLEELPVDFITVGQRKRALNADAVSRLAESIEKLGLRTPISVRYYDDRPDEDHETDDSHVLLAGAHRLAAMKQLGRETIPCFVFYDGDEVDAELWEIAENLHRADLTALERDEQVARWVELSLSQVATNPLGGRPATVGVRAAERDLGIKKDDAARATKVASLSDEAKAAAREVGLDDNRTALLAAARAPVDQQAAVVRDYAEKRKPISVDSDVQHDLAKMFAARLAEKFGLAEWDWVKSTLYALKAKVIADAFVNETGAGSPLMDRRYSA